MYSYTPGPVAVVFGISQVLLAACCSHLVYEVTLWTDPVIHKDNFLSNIYTSQSYQLYSQSSHFYLELSILARPMQIAQLSPL